MVVLRFISEIVKIHHSLDSRALLEYALNLHIFFHQIQYRRLQLFYQCRLFERIVLIFVIKSHLDSILSTPSVAYWNGFDHIRIWRSQVVNKLLIKSTLFLDMICLAPVSKQVSKENDPLILFYFEYSSGYLYRDLLLKKINTVLKNGYLLSYIHAHSG